MKFKLFILVLICFSLNLQAGPISWAKEKAKDKAKDKVVDTSKDLAKEVYLRKKDIRRDYEQKTSTKSTLSKAEDTYENTKQTAKEAAIGSFGGQENVDYVKRGKGYVKEAFIGQFVKEKE